MWLYIFLKHKWFFVPYWYFPLSFKESILIKFPMHFFFCFFWTHFSDTPAPIKGLVTPRNIDVDSTFYFLLCFVYLGYRGLAKQATYAFPVIPCCSRCENKKGKKKYHSESEVKRGGRKDPWRNEWRQEPSGILFPRYFTFCFL